MGYSVGQRNRSHETYPQSAGVGQSGSQVASRTVTPNIATAWVTGLTPGDLPEDAAPLLAATVQTGPAGIVEVDASVTIIANATDIPALILRWAEGPATVTGGTSVAGPATSPGNVLVGGPTATDPEPVNIVNTAQGPTGYADPDNIVTLPLSATLSGLTPNTQYLFVLEGYSTSDTTTWAVLGAFRATGY